MPWCVQDDIDRDRDRSIPKSPQQPSSGRKPPCRPPPVQESCTWMGKRASPGGKEKQRCWWCDAATTTTTTIILLLRTQGERNLVRFFYIFLFDFVPASALPLDTRDALLPMLLFSTGGEGGGVTHNGACNNEYLRITFWAKKTGGRGGRAGVNIRCSRLVLTYIYIYIYA